MLILASEVVQPRTTPAVIGVALETGSGWPASISWYPVPVESHQSPGWTDVATPPGGVMVPAVVIMEKNSAFPLAEVGITEPTVKPAAVPSVVTVAMNPVVPLIVPANVRLLLTAREFICS